MDLDPTRARALIGARQASVLDVRTPEEYALLGHIPGARLVPVQELEERLSEIVPPSEGATLIVVCEHGMRSRWACGLLAGRGLPAVANLAGGMSVWPFEREMGIPEGPEADRSLPSSWLVRNIPHLRFGTALDVACGTGRNSLLLARMGWRVTAVDRDEAALETLGRRATHHGVGVRTIARDLEAGEGLAGLIPAGGFDLVVVINYLHRPLLPELRGAVRPGGVILYETYTTEQAEFGRPTNPDFLLREGELEAALKGFETLAARRGLVATGRAVAGIVARRPRQIPEHGTLEGNGTAVKDDTVTPSIESRSGEA